VGLEHPAEVDFAKQLGWKIAKFWTPQGRTNPTWRLWVFIIIMVYWQLLAIISQYLNILSSIKYDHV
jgi:hypothetical protein